MCLSHTDLLFVYGTLKRGYGNNCLLDGSEFVGEAVTVEDCVMLNRGFPVMMLREFHAAKHLWRPARGELFRVTDAKTWETLDALEGVPLLYCRENIMVKKDDGETLCAITYAGNPELYRDSGGVCGVTDANVYCYGMSR